MKIIPTTLFGLLLLGASPATAAEMATIDDAALACRAQSDFEPLGRMASAGDGLAFKRKMLELLMSGRCVGLDAGTRVYVERAGLHFQLVRVVGETESFFVLRGYVK
jgi:hypothetical protein